MKREPLLVAWAHLDLDDAGWKSLETFAAWLIQEGAVAGGLGPREPARLWSRHILDSLVFARGWYASGLPADLVDIGSGLGLPGIPLAISWPEVEVTLLDRSEKRTDLARRAVRMLDLPNVRVVRGDVWEADRRWDGVVMRAVFPIEEAAAAARRVLAATGRAVLGLRGPLLQRERLENLGALVEVRSEVLDGPASLLIMRGSGT